MRGYARICEDMREYAGILDEVYSIIIVVIIPIKLVIVKLGACK